jgi:hypothetical protein
MPTINNWANVNSLFMVDVMVMRTGSQHKTSAKNSAQQVDSERTLRANYFILNILDTTPKPPVTLNSTNICNLPITVQILLTPF